MTWTIRAHFDGRVIVPDEPIDLPVNQTLEVELKPFPAESPVSARERRRAALQRVAARAIHGLNIPTEVLRREHLYEGLR
jgi:hypothetical protein